MIVEGDEVKGSSPGPTDASSISVSATVMVVVVRNKEGCRISAQMSGLLGADDVPHAVPTASE